MNFKLTEICISIKTFYCQKEENSLILFNLSLFLIFRECWRVKNFNPDAKKKKIAKKNLFSDIVKINATVELYGNDYAMPVA